MSRGYDIEMIRDFIKHLKLEVENLHAACIDARGTGVWCLAQQLLEYANKYDCNLLDLPRLDAGDATAAEVELAYRIILNEKRNAVEKWLEAFNSLDELLKEAFETANRKISALAPGASYRIEMNVKDILNQQRKG